MGISYRDSGVDVKGGDAFVKRISPMVKSTFTDRVITDIGGFGALYSAAFPDMKEPVLVSGTDGVGTKIQIARMMNRHNTIGIDLVAMCVNDIITSGASPLFFLDYISTGRLNSDVLEQVISGIAEGCRLGGCSLIGGETAEHPGVMADEDYDLAGFAVGVADREKIIDGKTIEPGDSVIGLASSGIHSNGYSLVRKLLLEQKKYPLDRHFETLGDTLGNILLAPTRIYAQSILACLNSGIQFKGIVHITGGGFYENIPRMLPENCAAVVETDRYDVPPVFPLIQKKGAIDSREMYSTFNMGIGMIAVVPEHSTDEAVRKFTDEGEKASVIGSITSLDGEKVVVK